MTTIIVNHRVKDYATWKPGFDGDEANRKATGATLVAVGEKAGDPGNVFMIFNVEDMAKLQEFMANPELQQKMQELGVIGAPDVTVLS